MPIEILMPALSPTMEEGKLSKWLIKEGEIIKPGDIIAEIETDKAVMEFETVDEGIVKEILVNDGTEGIKINSPIATIEIPNEQKNNISEQDLNIEQHPTKEKLPIYKENQTPNEVIPESPQSITGSKDMGIVQESPTTFIKQSVRMNH